MKSAFYFALLLLLPWSAGAQTYRLMAASGDVTVNSNGQWKKATTGATLVATDKIKVGEKSYAALALNNAHTFEIKQAGTYTMSDFNKAKTANSSMVGRYIEYTINRSTNNNMGNNMANLGAVERSMAPTPLAPRNATEAGQTVRFWWEPQPGAKSYQFEFTDQDGKTIYSTNVEDTTITVDLSTYQLEADQPYFWHIANSQLKGLHSDEFSFKLMSPSKQAEIEKTIRDMKADGDENSAVFQMVLAGYYQDNGMNDAAMQAYDKAVSLQPQVTEYRKAYADFLQKMGLQAYSVKIMGQSK